jgi:hypothetical protein
MLDKLVLVGVVERRDEPDLEYRWVGLDGLILPLARRSDGSRSVAARIALSGSDALERLKAYVEAWPDEHAARTGIDPMKQLATRPSVIAVRDGIADVVLEVRQFSGRWNKLLVSLTRDLPYEAGITGLCFYDLVADRPNGPWNKG